MSELGKGFSLDLVSGGNILIRSTDGEFKPLRPGDANLDGVFDSSDFVHVFGFAQYEGGIEGNSTWESGDWNGDLEFDSNDLVLAFEAGGYQGAAVPEPCTMALLFVVVISITTRRQRYV